MTLRERLTTATLVLLFSVSVWLSATVLIESNQASKLALCQSKWNAQYQTVQTLRSRWATEDRDALTAAIKTIAEAQSPDAVENALANYLRVVEENDQKRAAAKVPEVPKGCKDVIIAPSAY